MPIQIVAYRGAGHKEAPPIQSDLINSVTMAKTIGRRFFDDPARGSYYLTKYHKFTAPYKIGVAPGTFIEITSSKMGLTNAEMRVESVRIFNGNATIMCDIEATQFIDPMTGV